MAAVLLAIALSILFVDRPAATWSHASFGADGPASFVKTTSIALTHLVDPIVPLALLGLVAFGLSGARVPAPGSAAREAFTACLATLVAVAAKDQLKLAFGRLWPETWTNGNPSWIGEGVFGFFPFHGGTGWSSFPSGHMAVVTAPMAVLMIARPRWRAVAGLPVLLVAAGLFGADYHFPGDILAGAAVGVGCAVLVRSGLLHLAARGR